MKTPTDPFAAHPFLARLTAEQLVVISQGAKEKVFEAGETIFRQGEPADQFHLIQEGQVILETRSPSLQAVPIQTLGPGDALGWSWLFPPFVWQLSARALQRTKTICLKGGHLLVAAEEDHNLGYELMKRIAQIVIDRLQATWGKLLEAGPSSWTPPASAPASGAAPAEGDIHAAIGKHRFFTGFAPRFLEVIAAHAMQSRFEAGQHIFKIGDPANRFYLLQHGQVALEAPSRNGSALIQIIRDGDVLGWSWLFEPYTWHFNARALQPTSAIFVYGTRLREVCETDHDLGYALMRRVTDLVINRLQATRRQLVNTTR